MNLLSVVSSLPSAGKCALFVRHAPAVPAEGMKRVTVGLTDDGKALASELGRRLGERLVCIHTSDYPRYVQTADAIGEGAGFRGSYVTDILLGNPSIYVVDRSETELEKQFKEIGHEEIGEMLMQDSLNLPGWVASPKDAACRLVQHILARVDEAASKGGRADGVGVFVSHDIVIAATVAHALGVRLPREEWPGYLEGAVIWREGNGVQVKYGNRSGPCRLAV